MVEVEEEEANTLRAEQIAYRLFVELNRAAIGIPSDGWLVIISDYEEEEHDIVGTVLANAPP
jgi:hypothetical protein